ncbi:virginiamycin B lyase family protein [Deinococcus sp. UYEF24]
MRTSSLALLLLPALLLGACGQPVTDQGSAPVTAAPSTPASPQVQASSLYEVQFRGVGSDHSSSSVSAIRAGLGAQTLRNVDDSQLAFTPLTVDTFSAGTTRYVRAVYTVTNNTGAALDHLTFVPVNTDPDPNATTPASTTPTVGATYFKALTRFDESDTSARATDLTPITGMIYSTAQGTAITDADATPYTALDTSVLTPVAPAGLVINGRASSGWRSNASIAAGASARVTFAVAIANTSPQTDPFNFSVVVASGNDVVPAPTVTAIRPALGLNSTTVTITGTNFRVGPSVSVKFGSLAADSVTVNSSTSLTVTSPSNLPAGKVDIVVTNSAGSSATSSADLFDQLVFSDYSVPTDNSALAGITAGPDGNLWFVENGSDQIGRITTTGVVKNEYSVPITGSSSGLLNIVTGPDNALWFTENNANRIGRITVAGAVTEFTTPAAAGIYTTGITVGPDSQLWFTERTGINRVSTAGKFDTDIKTGGQSEPNYITKGADGNLWSTDTSSNVIRRTIPRGGTTSFGTTSFIAPSAVRVGSLPAGGGITSNTDGNLWFTEPGANKIGRITPTGVVTEFTVPTPNANPAEIVSDSDGNLWFTESDARKIARVTPAGVFNEFAVPTSGSSPYGIAIGPDNNIWFTDVGTNRIGVLRR